MTEKPKHINDRRPNFYSKDGIFFLVKCYSCSKQGTENWACNVSRGQCAWCGWDVELEKEKTDD